MLFTVRGALQLPLVPEALAQTGFYWLRLGRRKHVGVPILAGFAPPPSDMLCRFGSPPPGLDPGGLAPAYSPLHGDQARQSTLIRNSLQSPMKDIVP